MNCVSFNFNFFPKVRRSPKNIFGDHDLKISVVEAFCLLFCFSHLVNRAFLKGATNFSLNKSVNCKGSYDHLQAANFDLS